ncbi:MAG: TRC40/GET3/ArsA family transport-energizing ATPase, partial [Cyanobacteria bacterium SZAS TMP-1]|nr:TRC40/GET3/ArsA family transport-energizing ATPase [Cyanobacteria bacterium SZAS TMP-1]
MNLIESATRYLFFTGKGGVGKTSLSCAVAIALADRGKKVLLVSTDPASNLDEVLQVKLGQTATEIPAVPGLYALNIDPEAAACAYRERLVGPYRDLLPEATVKSMEEQLSGSCTTEIAAFDEFAKLIGDAEQTKRFDNIIFDTAPTGHTMRLLSLPESWSTFISENTTGMSCLGPLSGLAQQQEIYLSAVQSLKDPLRTTLVLVTRP